MKLKNISLTTKSIKVNGEFISVKPFEVAELPVSVYNNEEGWAMEDDKKDSEGKYSKTDLKDMKKVEQVKILKDFGLSPTEIKLLSNEDNRVEAILKQQGN